MALRKANDDTAQAAEQIYALAKADADQQLTEMRETIEAVREESFGMGALHAIDANIAYNEFLKAMTLYRIKQAKEYRKGGMTWDAFCQARGLAWRTVDRMLEDMSPIFETFSVKMTDFCGMPFSKIRMLGKQLSANLAEINENNCLVYGDESIPVTPDHAEDIQALIDRISDDTKNKLEEAEAQVSAKDKVLKSKQELLNKQERELKKYEKEAAAKGFTPAEDAFLQQINNLKMSFDGYLLRADPEALLQLVEADDLTPRMRSALISTFHYMKMQILAEYDTAVMAYGNPVMNPELLDEFNKWEQGQE